jgi:predicted flap endonuclease-1-like 5' DNA nuclease
MDPLTTLLLTSTLASLLALTVLIFPLVFMFAGHLRPWLEQCARERTAAAAIMPKKVGPSARRTAAGRKSAAGKVAISRSTNKKAASKPKKKAATAKKKTAKKKSATKRKTTKKAATGKKSSPKKKAAPAKKKAAAKKAAAKKATAKKKAPAGATVDPVLGVVFKKKPKASDDLKKITGVAKVLEGKLHAEGVYTYQQIADWTPAQMDAFGERLSFKNRIQRDNWKKQAKALHKEKCS